MARGRFSFSVKWLCAPRGCACGVGQVFSFGQMALRSARVRLRRGAGFFFRSNGFALRAGAPAAWGRFFLLVKWLCAPRGPERRAGFFFELVLALVARGMFSLLVKWLALRAGQSALSLRLIILF